ncbi:MAG: hypothetical protein II858_07810 [Bacteroidales bacterium]|nr:hypothetical protein [Bacteroidales bacterium]
MEIRKLNYRAGWLIADYLNETPRAITPELLRSVLPDGADPAAEEYVYAALLAGFLGLDAETSEEDRFIEANYLRPGLQRLDTALYKNDPYYRNIRIPALDRDGWSLAWQDYQPYELFLRDDLILTDDLRQIPAIGYFPEPFSYPSVLQDGREWMSIKPSEIESSRPAVEAACGRVVTFGLGLGYFAYMAARKPDVTSVTVVERDPAVLTLFREHILPQIPEREKIVLVQDDAFDFLERRMAAAAPDFVFMDIWHDIADGTPLYVRAKQFETRFPHTRFCYWIGRSLRCALVDELAQRADRR